MTSVDWRVAYDKQMELWGWWHTPVAGYMADGYMASVTKSGHGAPMMGRALVRGQQEVLFNADPIVVDHDMMTLIEAAAETFPPEPLRREDMLTPVGFVWLPRPFRVMDVNQKYLTIRCFAWGPVTYRATAEDGTKDDREGLMLSYYSWGGDSEVDDYAEDQRLFMAAYNIDLSMVHWEPWMFGDSYNPHANPGSQQDTLRFIQTMWRLMQQTIATMEREQPQRAARRRAARAGMPDKHVTVIRLRRPKKPLAEDHVPKDIEWQSRWMVRGHWRNQWFSSLGPASDPSTHRAIWVSPYVKGPEDKPLVMKRLRAFEFVR